jgi:hypothetical protein
MTLNRFTEVLLSVVTCSVWAGIGVAQNQDTKTLLDRISKRPFETTVIGDVERSRDPALLPALRQAFEESEGKREKQYIAGTLIKLGDKDARYFEYLAGFARRAVESSAPTIFTTGPDGMVVKGVVNPEFDRWCREHGLDVQRELANQLRTYPEDLMLLATARDARGRDLLRLGLASQNPLIVVQAAQGLGVLDDRAYIPEIVSAASRFPVNTIGVSITAVLSAYQDEAVQREILAALPDPRLREMYTKALAERRRKQQVEHR